MSVSILQGPTVNLGGICFFAKARLDEILPVKHQKQFLLPWPTACFPALEKKEKPQETGLRLQMSAKVKSKKNFCKKTRVKGDPPLTRLHPSPRALVFRSPRGERRMQGGTILQGSMQECFLSQLAGFGQVHVLLNYLQSRVAMFMLPGGNAVWPTLSQIWDICRTKLLGVSSSHTKDLPNSHISSSQPCFLVCLNTLFLEQ